LWFSALDYADDIERSQLFGV